jgi:hypothetical protein
VVRTRKGYKVLFVEVPEELWYRLQAVAKVSYRSLTAQTTLALEEHLRNYETSESRELAGQLGEKDRPSRSDSALSPEPRGGKGRGRRDKRKGRG